MSSRLHTDVTIDASAERVWNILTDFAAYPDWNPFIRRISGLPVAGSRLEVRLQPPGGPGMTIRPTVLQSNTGRELRWLGSVGVRGIFDGEHMFRLEPEAPDRVRFVQEERFTGLLAPLVLRFIAASTRRGFAAMNTALKARAEDHLRS
jgi:hypothetical protein